LGVPSRLAKAADAAQQDKILAHARLFQFLATSQDSQCPVGFRLEQKTLSEDPDSGAATLVVHYPAGFNIPAAPRIGAAEEVLVLDGEIRFGPHHLRRDAYGYFPQGTAHGAISSDSGAVLLTFFDAAVLAETTTEGSQDTAIVIDTAGRFTIPVDDVLDKEEWQKFLTLLAKYRKREPINGLVVTIAADKLLESPPVSTEQIMHPARYPKDLPVEIVLRGGVLYPVWNVQIPDLNRLEQVGIALRTRIG